MKKRIVASFMLLVMLIVLLPTNNVQAETYQKGSQGINVQDLQKNLTFLGFSTIEMAGVYGDNTRKAVIDLQRALYLSETGIVDSELNELIKGTVADIQGYLKEKGYYSGIVDGVTGNITQNALKNLQKEKGYSQTGIIDYLILRDMVNDSNIRLENSSLFYWVLRLQSGGSTYKDEKYLTLFRDYPRYLDNETVNNVLSNYVKNADNVVAMNEDGILFGAILTALSEGKDIIWNQLVSDWSNNTKSYQEQMRLDAISCLMRDVCKNENLITVVAEEVGGAIETLRSGYNLEDINETKALCYDLSTISSTLSYDEIEEILNLICKDETLEKKLQDVSFGIDIAEYIVALVQLYQIEVSTLERLQSLLSIESDMYQDLEYLKQERNRDEVAYCVEYFTSPAIQDFLIEVFEKIPLPFPSNVVLAVSEVSIDIFTNHIYTGALSEELIQTYLLKSYVNTLKSALLEMTTKFMNSVTGAETLVTLKEIEDYEFIYSTYLAAVKNYLISVEKIADNGYKSSLNTAIDTYDELLNYDNYIRLCLNNVKENKSINEEKVLEKIDKLVKIFNAENGNIYFTSDGNPDRSPYDTSYVNSVISSSWFKKTFSDFGIPSGNDIANVVSNHYYPSNKKNNPGGLPRGTSCHGFGTWAVWYLFASNNSDFVQLEYVISNGEDSTAKLDYKTLSKYAKPGDLIRIQSTKDSSYGHSVIFISCDESGVTVLDCNWNGTCNIRKHTIPYTMDSSSMGQWGKCPIAISRASSYSVSIDDSVNITEIPNGEQWRVDRGSMNLRIRSGASTAYSQVGLVTFQDIVTVTKTQGNWGYITYNGVSGWICLDYCTKIEPIITQGPSNTSIPTVTIAPSNTTIPTTTPILTDFGWIKASECPTDANIVDTKWTYTYKETIEDSRPWIEGWTYGGERLETVSSGIFEYATFPNTFDKSSAIYTGMYTSKEAVPVTDGTERRIISDNMTGYIYWHYSYPISDRSVGNRIVGYYYNQKIVGCYATNFAAFKSPKTYSITANNKAGGGTIYKITDSEYMDYSIAKGSYWWYRFEYYTCDYEDVKTIYQHYRLVDKESVTEVVEGDAISNVVKWVKIEPIITQIPSDTVVTGTPTLRQETATEYFDYTIENGKVTIKGLKDKSLATVVIPEKIEEYGVTSIAVSAFQYCNNLNSISIPNSVISIGDYAFANCSSLSSIIIPSSVSSIGVGIFNSCNNLTEIIVENNNLMYSSKDGVLYNKDQTMLLCVPAGKKLQEYIIPNHVTSIGYYAFSDCTSLKSISISDNVSNIGEYAFNFCSSLTEINVTENNQIYSSKDGVLYNKNQNILLCMPSGKDLKNYEMPANIDTIGSAAFYDCKSLSSINISHNVTSIGNWAFAFCSNLKDINTSDSVTSIGEHAFFSCSSLKNVSLSHNMGRIQYATFYDCSNLISIIIPDGITMIELSAFSNCNNLVSVTIPSSVISINKDAFVGSNNVTIITPKGSYAEKYAKENNVPYENN